MHLPNQEKAKGLSTVLIVVVGLILAVILFGKLIKFGEGFLEGLGLKDSKEEKANKDDIDRKVNQANAKGNNSPWSPKFYKAAPSGTKIPTQSTADSLAKQLWESVGYIVDTPNKGAGAIKQCSTKAGVSFVADRFQVKYKLDLLTWLQSKYDTDEQREVLADMLRYVENLPNYK